MGIDQRQIAYIEGGKCFPSLRTLNKFTNVFHCSLKDLFDYEHLMPNNINLKEKIFNDISTLDNKSLNLYYEIVKAIKNNFVN